MHKESEVFVVVLPHVSMCGFNAAWVQDMGVLCTAIRPTDAARSKTPACYRLRAVFYCAQFFALLRKTNLAVFPSRSFPSM